VDLNRFRPASKEEHAVARAALNLQGDRFVFLFVGSGFERKGLDRLLETLPGKVLLLVVGKDRAESHYRAKADKLDLGDRVRFLGPQADVVLFYRAADAFVFPAIYEPFGNVVLEALACGLPVITSLQCGFEEFIEPGRNGWLVDAFDRVALKKAQEELTAVLADSLQRSSMALEARATAQRFAPAAMVGKLISLYRSLLN